MSALIQAVGLGKVFREKSVGANTEKFGLLRPKAVRKGIDRWALHDVNFRISAGEMLGVIGSNGAGKSTLLRLLGGIGKPTKGEVVVRGRIGGLLELGGGFHGDLTGRENVIIAAVVAGMLRKEAISRVSEIVRFAEMEDFIDEAARTYSTGMVMRLAFSVVVHTDPEVLLIDEYLSVGDLGFQAKCNVRIAELRDRGCAMILVSHGMDQIKGLCDRVLWLRRGEVVALDTAECVTAAFEDEMRRESVRRTPKAAGLSVPGLDDAVDRVNRFGSMDLMITRIELFPGSIISCGRSLRVELSYVAVKFVESPIFSVVICRDDGFVCYDLNTRVARASVPNLEGRGSISLEIERVDLAAGVYYLDVGAFEGGWSYAFDYQWHCCRIEVKGPDGHKGILMPPVKWTLNRLEEGAL